MSQESNLLTKLEQQMSNLEGMTGKRFLEVLSETATEFGWTLKNHRCYRDKIKVEILMSNIRYKKALLDVVTSRERKILLKKEIEELRASLKKTGENHNESF